MVIPARITPWPPNPPSWISSADMIACAAAVLCLERAAQLLVHQREEIGAVRIHELAQRDGALVGEPDFPRAGAVPDHARLLEIVHHVQAVAQAVPPLVERRAGAQD